MLQNYEVDITDFIKITSAGVQIANFPQIRAALIERYKSVYGDDIDLSTASADGIFVNDLALIINNICMSIQTFYGNMDVDNASGIYLDNLCKLSNITRKPATYSNASLTLTNENNFEVDVTNGMIFVDKSGTEWTYNGPTITLAKNAAEVKPAGPPPIIATFLPVDFAISGIYGSSEFKSLSPTNLFNSFIAIGSSTKLLLQSVSHG